MGEATIELPNDVDPNDEFAQLYALHKSYLDSTRESPKLLHAIVHESDRILRNSSDPSSVPAKFHKVYADALAMLSVFAKKPSSNNKKNKDKQQQQQKHDKNKIEQDGDLPEDFINAAIERATIGLDAYPTSAELLVTRSECYLTLSELKLQHSAKSKTVEGCVELIQKSLQDYDSVEQILQSDDATLTEDLNLYKTLARISNVLETTLESDFLAERFPEFYEWTENKWQNALASNPDDKDLHKGIGSFYLARASPYLAVVEYQYDEDDDDDNDNAHGENNESSATKQAKSYVQKSLDHLSRVESDDNGELMVTVGEAMISLANLYDQGSTEQQELYNQAIERLKKAEGLGIGDFQSLIDELRDPQQLHFSSDEDLDSSDFEGFDNGEQFDDSDLQDFSGDNEID
ncbi:negative regulator of Ofd1/Enhancer of translation termination 1 [Lipomyces japonicus]|uniref:negative regulator of Ofd1/Enhancer of translation termination 1 n=1 Tax=Lipomyces japonicus TaxID=56871 RepID=UPI0034CE6F8D